MPGPCATGSCSGLLASIDLIAEASDAQFGCLRKCNAAIHCSADHRVWSIL